MTNSLATLDLASIPAHIRDVLLAQDARLRADQETIREMRESKALLEVQNAELKVLNERRKHLVKEFRNALYAKRSEASNPDQLDLLFEDIEAAIAETTAEIEART